ncbi:MAG: hypothetical protein JO314_07640, partial [Acidobacteria bacterium]|nr:hypothetical protein [Acidobacteriota bacterium]
MKFLGFGALVLALTFCGITDKLKQLSAGGSGNSNAASGGKNSSGSATSSADPAKPSSSQQSIIDSGTETKW